MKRWTQADKVWQGHRRKMANTQRTAPISLSKPPWEKSDAAGIDQRSDKKDADADRRDRVGERGGSEDSGSD